MLNPENFVHDYVQDPQRTLFHEIGLQSNSNKAMIILYYIMFKYFKFF